MMRIYLIRHGETEWNIKGKYQGKTDIPLTQKGRRQAEAIGNRLKDMKVDGIYTSDLSRAKETAEQINGHHHVPLYVEKSLREIDFGEWEGYTVKQLEEIYGEQYKNFYSEPHRYSFPGEGSFENVKIRAKKTIQEIQNKHQEQNIAIVAHGGILKVIILILLGLEMSGYKQFWLGNTSLSIIDIKEDGKNVVSLLNDLCHLEIN